MRALDTLVKYTHGLIGAADLHLHKVRFVMMARGTSRHGPIHVFPGRGAPQNIIDNLALHCRLVRARVRNATRVRTTGAVKEGFFVFGAI